MRRKKNSKAKSVYVVKEVVAWFRMKKMGQKDDISLDFLEDALLVLKILCEILYFFFFVKLHHIQPHYNLLKDLMIHVQYVI